MYLPFRPKRFAKGGIMKTKLSTIILTTIALLLIAGQAAAFLDEVYLPESAETGTSVDVAIWGFLPDPCWVMQGVTTSVGDLVATIEITIFYDNPDGAACPQVIVPYETFPTLVFDEPGEWMVRIVELSIRPDFPDEEIVMEFLLPVTGQVSVDRATLDAVKALFR